MLRRLVPLAAALALAVAGCGGDDDDGGNGGATNPTTATQATTATAGADSRAYQNQVRTILGSVGTAGQALGASARSSRSPQDLARALETFQTSVEGAANRLNDLTAPAAAVEGQDELEQVLREIAAGVEPSIQSARSGDRAAFQRAFRAYQRKLDADYRRRLTAAGEKIDRALAGQ